MGIDALKNVAKLAANTTIPFNVLRDLSCANAQRAQLVMHRVALRIKAGDDAVTELIHKLMKVIPAKVA